MPFRPVLQGGAAGVVEVVEAGEVEFDGAVLGEGFEAVEDLGEPEEGGVAGEVGLDGAGCPCL